MCDMKLLSCEKGKPMLQIQVHILEQVKRSTTKPSLISTLYTFLVIVKFWIMLSKQITAESVMWFSNVLILITANKMNL